MPWHPFAQFPLGKFRHHNGAVHQHPHGQYQTEKDNNIERDIDQKKREQCRQKRARNRDAHQETAPHAQRGDHHNHHEQDRADNTVLKVIQHRPDLIRAVL